MEILSSYHEFVGALVARLFLGTLFFFQGYDAVFKVKIKNVIGAYEEMFKEKGLPKFITVAGSYYTCLTELICGFLLIIGLFQYEALYLLGINLLLAGFAFGFNSPMWDTRHVLPRLLLLVLLLLLPEQWNAWSFDHLIFK